MPLNAIHTTNISSTGLTVGLYVACVLGALTLILLLPRTRQPAVNVRVIGWLLGAATLGGLLLAFTRFATATDPAPNAYFYLFAFIAVFGAMKVVTHARPVFAALYFILTVLASAAMFLLLAAEFMAFALIIVYAGAILITYLFVIMLAYNESEETARAFRDGVDSEAREPVAASCVGFLLLAVLTSLFADSLHEVPRDLAERQSPPAVSALVGKVETSLRQADLLDEGQRVLSVDAAAGTAIVGTPQTPRTVELPEQMAIENIEYVGWDLLAEFPVSLELAGIILLLAMIGAVVLVRQTPGGQERPEQEEAAS